MINNSAPSRQGRPLRHRQRTSRRVCSLTPPLRTTTLMMMILGGLICLEPLPCHRGAMLVLAWTTRPPSVARPSSRSVMSSHHRASPITVAAVSGLLVVDDFRQNYRPTQIRESSSASGRLPDTDTSPASVPNLLPNHGLLSVTSEGTTVPNPFNATHRSFAVRTTFSPTVTEDTLEYWFHTLHGMDDEGIHSTPKQQTVSNKVREKWNRLFPTHHQHQQLTNDESQQQVLPSNDDPRADHRWDFGMTV